MGDGCTIDVGLALEMVQTVRRCSLMQSAGACSWGWSGRWGMAGVGSDSWEIAGTDAEGWKMAGGRIDSESEEW